MTTPNSRDQPVPNEFSSVPQLRLVRLHGAEQPQFTSVWRFGEARDVVRHDDVCGDDECVADAHHLEGALEEIARIGRSWTLESVIAAKCDEVKRATLLIANKALRHGCILLRFRVRGI